MFGFLMPAWEKLINIRKQQQQEISQAAAEKASCHQVETGL